MAKAHPEYPDLIGFWRIFMDASKYEVVSIKEAEDLWNKKLR